MEGKMEINYKWKCDQEIDIPQKHEDALKEDAENRIFEMIKEGYYQGELNTSVRYGKDIVPEEDEDDGLTYSGWWSVSYSVCGIANDLPDDEFDPDELREEQRLDDWREFEKE